MINRLLYYLAPLLKVITFVIFILLCLIPFWLIGQLNLISLNPKSFSTELIAQAALTIAIIGALLIVFQTYSPLNFSTVFIVKQRLLSGFLKGSLIGFILILLCGGLLYINGYVTFALGNVSLILFFSYLIYFLLVGIFEELMFRSFPLFAFAESYPIVIAITVNSLLFGLAHYANPGFTNLALLNISLAGAIFCIFTILKRNIGWAIGIHFGWNFTQGILLGYKVSGTDSLGLLNATPKGPVYLSGGTFGIEGSVICTIILGLFIIILIATQKFFDIKNEVYTTLAEEL